MDFNANDSDDGSADSRSGGSKGPKKRNNYRSGGYDQGAARPKRIDEFAASNTTPDYKDYEKLRRFVSNQGKILPRRRSGLSAKNQRLVARAIKRARHLALLAIPGTLNK